MKDSYNETDYGNDIVVEKAKLTQKQMRERQQNFAVLHFFCKDMFDFLGIQEDGDNAEGV